MVLNEVSGAVMSSVWFDTYEDSDDSQRLMDFLQGLRKGRILCFAVKVTYLESSTTDVFHPRTTIIGLTQFVLTSVNFRLPLFSTVDSFSKIFCGKLKGATKVVDLKFWVPFVAQISLSFYHLEIDIYKYGCCCFCKSEWGTSSLKFSFSVSTYANGIVRNAERTQSGFHSRKAMVQGDQFIHSFFICHRYNFFYNLRLK